MQHYKLTKNHNHCRAFNCSMEIFSAKRHNVDIPEHSYIDDWTNGCGKKALSFRSINA
jgi:hypothetical protein